MSYCIKQMPESERPRERALKYGVSQLSDAELLAIVLKTGTKNKSVKELAMEVLNLFEQLSNLCDMTIPRICSIKGIGVTKAIELSSCIELGKRIFLSSEQKTKQVMTNPKMIWQQSHYLFHHQKQEYFYCLYLNQKQVLIERKLLFMGTLDRSVVHPREVFKSAYLTSASSIICLHNHPSNDVRPSKEDILFTKSLVEIGRIQGIPVVDHIIIGETGYYSFYENGLIQE